MATVTIQEAEAQLEELIARAEAGEEIVITRDKAPITQLTALTEQSACGPPRRVFGAMADRYPHIPDAFFFDPLPDDELEAWQGGNDDAATR